jgi:catechol 2,3-dioxygenase-like lactoylglutathione lyase family enzyme
VIDHLGLRVSDLARATAFYVQALEPLGYGIVMQISAAETGDGGAVGFGTPGPAADFQSGKPSFWIGQGERVSGPVHVAVDAFYQAAIAAGGSDNGKPGLRPHYHANYYGAFVLDLDGNNIEAVCHAPS